MKRRALRLIGYAATLAAFATLAACGSDDEGGQNGGPGVDGGPEGDLVRVVVYDDGETAPGMDVVFHDESGGVLAHVQTGAEGSANHESPEISMVTLARPGGSLSTIAGVEGGDELIFGLPGARPTDEIGTVTFEPPASAPSDAQFWIVTIGCAVEFSPDLTESVEVELHAGCLRDDNSSFAAYAYALGESGERVAYTFDNEISASADTVELPDWRTDFSRAEITLENAPAGTYEATSLFGFTVENTSGAYYVDSRAAPLESGGSWTFELDFGQGFGDTFFSDWGVYTGPEGDPTGWLYEQRMNAAPPGARTVDLEADVLPRIHDVNADVTEPGRPLITWQSERAAGDIDAVSVFASWSEGSWGATLPPGASSSYQFPELPEDLASHRPPSNEEFAPLSVRYTDSSAIDSYRQYRGTRGLRLRDYIAAGEDEIVIRYRYGGQIFEPPPPQAQIQFEWSIVEDGEPATCGEVGADRLIVNAGPIDGSDNEGAAYAEACPENAETGVLTTIPIALGDYEVFVFLWDDDEEETLAFAAFDEVNLEEDGEVVDLGAIDLVVEPADAGDLRAGDPVVAPAQARDFADLRPVDLVVQ